MSIAYSPLVAKMLIDKSCDSTAGVRHGIAMLSIRADPSSDGAECTVNRQCGMFSR